MLVLLPLETGDALLHDPAVLGHVDLVSTAGGASVQGPTALIAQPLLGRVGADQAASSGWRRGCGDHGLRCGLGLNPRAGLGHERLARFTVPLRQLLGVQDLPDVARGEFGELVEVVQVDLQAVHDHVAEIRIASQVGVQCQVPVPRSLATDVAVGRKAEAVGEVEEGLLVPESVELLATESELLSIAGTLRHLIAGTEGGVVVGVVTPVLAQHRLGLGQPLPEVEDVRRDLGLLVGDRCRRHLDESWLIFPRHRAKEAGAADVVEAAAALVPADPASGCGAAQTAQLQFLEAVAAERLLVVLGKDGLAEGAELLLALLASSDDLFRCVDDGARVEGFRLHGLLGRGLLVELGLNALAVEGACHDHLLVLPGPFLG